MGNNLNISDIITNMDSVGMIPIDASSIQNNYSSISVPQIFSELGDILALGKIDNTKYFQLKSMLLSYDDETKNLAQKLIYAKLQEL